jgi:hypothetical protein
MEDLRMKKRFDERAIGILREADWPGVQIWEVWRPHNITEQTFLC